MPCIHHHEAFRLEEIMVGDVAADIHLRAGAPGRPDEGGAAPPAERDAGYGAFDEGGDGVTVVKFK